MHFLEYYYDNIIKRELIYKFNYKNLLHVPKLKKIVLSFNCRNSDLKQISKTLLALELLSEKKAKITLSKKHNILLKIRKGTPVGCKIILRRTAMYTFFCKLLFEIFPKLENVTYRKLQSLNVSYMIHNTLVFSEFQDNYYLFNTLPKLHIVIVIATKSKKEILYLLNSFKILSN